MTLRRAAVAVAVTAVLAAALGIGVRATPSEPVAVDEPQYLLTALSLASDGDLDITNQLAGRQWRQFTGVEPPVETVAQPDGSQISPHDPLLPLLLTLPMGLGGWIAAKLALALLAGALAALTLWVAVRRFAIPLPVASSGVAIASASAPLAVYGQQVYPELPAALACLVGVAALTGPPRRGALVVLALAIVALPWLSVKYAPVAAALAALGLLRWWHAGADAGADTGAGTGRRRDVFVFAAALAIAGASYLLAHQLVWGGWTAYASGDHFQRIGEFGVVGENPNYWRRAWRLPDLLVDRQFGLVAWQPAWLLLVPALAALAARRMAGAAALVVPLAAGWLVATFPALTMHGYWWPGRQVVVVLPLAVLIVLCWLARAGLAIRTAAALLGLAGVANYGFLLADGLTGEITWVHNFGHVDSPVYRVVRPLLADYLYSTSNLVWLGIFAVLGTAAYAAANQGVQCSGKNEA